MKNRGRPRLRTVDKSQPPYPLNSFPSDFGKKLGREIVYLLATKSQSDLQGSEWEEIFAKCIGADWKPSNVGLDDIVIGSAAWGAKTVKSNNPHTIRKIRLISGRNSPAYSFGESRVSEVDPVHLGSLVIEIWNERVSAVRSRFRTLRTIVLIKSPNLTELTV